MTELPLLSQVRVASPCPASWARMKGDARVRFCGSCKLNVYNLSELTAADAEQLIASHEGRLCVRYYQRRDGTVLTRNCPVGVWRVRRALVRVGSAVAGLALALLGGVTAIARAAGYGSAVARLSPFREMLDVITPPRPLVGVLCAPSTQIVVPRVVPLGSTTFGDPNLGAPDPDDGEHETPESHADHTSPPASAGSDPRDGGRA
ncbi:MAG: hypothetical protein AB7Q17_03770 [Phycisphaerae bacterium]